MKMVVRPTSAEEQNAAYSALVHRLTGSEPHKRQAESRAPSEPAMPSVAGVAGAPGAARSGERLQRANRKELSPDSLGAERQASRAASI